MNRVCVLIATITGFILLPLLNGCAVTWNGHDVPVASIRDFKSGKTTADEVKKVLGPPEDILVKPFENVTVFVYRSTVNVFVGLPIPVLTLGRTKQTGYLLHVFFKDGLYVGYDLTTLEQRLL